MMRGRLESACATDSRPIKILRQGDYQRSAIHSGEKNNDRSCGAAVPPIAANAAPCVRSDEVVFCRAHGDRLSPVAPEHRGWRESKRNSDSVLILRRTPASCAKSRWRHNPAVLAHARRPVLYSTHFPEPHASTSTGLYWSIRGGRYQCQFCAIDGRAIVHTGTTH